VRPNGARRRFASCWICWYALPAVKLRQSSMRSTGAGRWSTCILYTSDHRARSIRGARGAGPAPRGALPKLGVVWAGARHGLVHRSPRHVAARDARLARGGGAPPPAAAPAVRVREAPGAHGLGAAATAGRGADVRRARAVAPTQEGSRAAARDGRGGDLRRRRRRLMRRRLARAWAP
jgi:hypothetical protein